MPLNDRSMLGHSVVALLCWLVATTTAFAQSAPAQPAPAPAGSQPFAVGPPLKLTPNAKVYGGFRFAESIGYDAERDPYVADIDTVRWFDMKTGEPKGQVQVPGVIRFNDLEVADDGTIYATQTGAQDPASWRVYKITPDGQPSVLIQGAPLNLHNGIAFDLKGNLVVVNIGTNDVHTFSAVGTLIATEQAVDPGNDGIVVLADGTKYVSSVRLGTVSRIRPGQKAEIIASGIPSAASMTYDSKRHRLVIPMNDWNAITIVEFK